MLFEMSSVLILLNYITILSQTREAVLLDFTRRLIEQCTQ